ncbi:uncharacterized protein LOC121740530 [Aricia agestis]|uniref:uncharacterized protein LOC121740530 n=1 Tax=Aricia agestis TaxID=91739 RepID=UPI001C209B6E|nr:uncharacterized protein LOC121740530 [Aricia agestis]
MKKYKHVVLNKQTGKVTPKQRDEAWQSLTVEFNNDPACSVSRSTTQLKNKWDYMKRNAKKDVAAYKRAHRQTGGGKGPAPLDDTTAILIDTARESIEGTPSKFDSDKTVSSNIIVLGNDTIDFLSPPATVTIPEEESFENTTNSYYMQPILCTTQKTNDKIDATSIKDKSDLCKSSSLIKRQKLNDTPLVQSTPQYTRSKFVEVAEKKIQWLNNKEDVNKKKTSLEVEILEKKSENASLEKKKLLLECDAHNLEIDIKQLIKKKLELELLLLEKQCCSVQSLRLLLMLHELVLPVLQWVNSRVHTGRSIALRSRAAAARSKDAGGVDVPRAIHAHVLERALPTSRDPCAVGFCASLKGASVA